jgi:hypothetical protein
VVPQAPQFWGSSVVSVQRGEQHVSPLPHALPSPQKPTHWKFEHSSPLGHWLFSVHTTHVWVSSRQCGVGAEQSASDVQPSGTGTHMCVIGLQVSPEGQSAFVVQPSLELPPVPELVPKSEVRPQPAAALAKAIATNNV